MRRRLTWDQILGIVLFLLAACFLAVSVFLCFSDDIWYDELFTMGLADQSFGELISVTARDVHPPLYYIIVKLFLMLFQGAGICTASGPGGALTKGVPGMAVVSPVAVAKLVSVLPFFLCLVYGAVKVRRFFGMLAAGLFSFLLLTMPQLAGYTVEARMYGWALFFVTAGMLHGYELTLADKGFAGRAFNWTALTLYGLAACYTHYFACVAAVMIYGYLLLALRKGGRLRERWKPFLISGGFCALGYLPWIVGAVGLQVGQVKENYWIGPVTLRTLGGCVKFLFQPAFASGELNTVLAVVLFLIYAGLMALSLTGLLAGGGWNRRKGSQAERTSERQNRHLTKALLGDTGGEGFFVAGALGVLAGILAFGFGASLLIRPVFVYRYMLPALGLFWLAFALLLSRHKEKKAVFVPILLLLLVVGIRDYRAFYGEEMWKRLQMGQVQEALSMISREDAMVFNFDQTQGVATYYLPNESYLWYQRPEELIVEMYPQNHPLVEGDFSDEAGIAALKELLARHERVWFCGSGNAREEIIEKWEEQGIGAREQGDVMLERYWFKLYLVTDGAGS